MFQRTKRVENKKGRESLLCFFEGAFEGGLVGFFLEDSGMRGGAVQDIIDGVVLK